MISDPDIPELAAWIDVSTLHVYAPTPIIFVCGGKCDVTQPAPQSLRDAFLRVSGEKELKKYNSVKAEDLNAFFPKGNYKDIMSFEVDLAQIVEVILLFSESEGSLAELGAFAMLDEIARRLLVVIDDKNYNSPSFITLGPLRKLSLDWGDVSVCVISRSMINISDIKNLSGINVPSFKSLIVNALKNREAVYRERTTFDKQRDGHIIKLMVGILQLYGALTLEEIGVYLFQLGVSLSDERMISYLLCAEFADWVIAERRGLYMYYAAIPAKSAIDYKLIPGSPIVDKDRWRVDLNNHWRNSDDARFDVIKLAISKSTT